MVQAIKTTESSDVMQEKLKGKDFLRISDFSTAEILYLLEEAKELKKTAKVRDSSSISCRESIRNAF